MKKMELEMAMSEQGRRYAICLGKNVGSAILMKLTLTDTLGILKKPLIICSGQKLNGLGYFKRS